MKLLITLCRSVAPAVAQEVETSMRAEYLQLKEKAKNEASEVSTDTPFNVLANSSSDFNLTEGGSGSGGGESESAKQAPIRNAFKLANSPYWDGWVGVETLSCYYKILDTIERSYKLIN
jgi:hypothetical protein